jgi:hypothetical protein
MEKGCDDKRAFFRDRMVQMRDKIPGRKKNTSSTISYSTKDIVIYIR